MRKILLVVYSLFITLSLSLTDVAVGAYTLDEVEEHGIPENCYLVPLDRL